MTNKNIEKVIEIYRRSSINIVKASFEGIDNSKGKIKIKQIYLDILKSRTDRSIGLQNPEQYFINKDFIDQFFQIKAYYGVKTSNYDSNEFLNQIFITEFVFEIKSNIDLQYETAIDHKEIISRWNLVNFMIGTPNSKSTVDSPKRLNIKVKKFSIEFVSEENYNKIISQSFINKNADVTAHAKIVTAFRDMNKIEKIFKDVCILLSFANCNWIVPFSKNIYQDEKIIMTTFFPITNYSLVV